MLASMAPSKRQGFAAKRTVAGLALAAVTLAAALVAGAPWPVTISGSWGVAALVITTSIWLRIARMDAKQTKANARDEDFSRAISDLVVLSASVASLIAVGYTLLEAGSRHGVTKALLMLLALAVVAFSWTTVHTLYTVRYGDLYYGDPVGGIDFNDDDPPDYHDFAYLAFTIGMTFQVSDTNLCTKTMRRTATRHGLLSFVFVAVIFALAINSAASLLQ
jgi:uncharacterized membrane protein